MIVFGKPTGSPYATCDHTARTITANVDRLLLNPNRVLLSVTPFRLRQEAVLTGCLLHEAGHARHSHWLPKDKAEAKVRPCVHSDGTTPSPQTIALARTMEEPRVEGLMVRDAEHVGAAGLDWTMRASAAHLLPMTAMSTDPNKAIMDLIESWALRAGRQYAIHNQLGGNYRLRKWVGDFTSLLHNALVAHLTEAEAHGADIVPVVEATQIADALIEMTTCDDDTGPGMVDMARDVLARLFPETDPDDQPTAGGGCASEPEDTDGEEGESDEAGEQGEGNTEPEDEGSGTDPGAGDSGDDDAEPDKADQSGDEQESGTEEGTEDGGGSSESDEQGEDGPESQSDGSGSDSADTDSDTEADSEADATDSTSPLAQALADMENEAKSESTEQAEEDEEDAEEAMVTGSGAGGGAGGGSWRTPTKDEREMQKGAERFLRDLISPSESSKVTLTEAPSATVDPAALAAWKAGGQVSDPRFFKRIKRTVEPSPPVKIAILVDVSISMSELQRPSAQLSWALGAAALDLRNFAGRGQQVESCMIHWGDRARVIQRNGEMLPGLREWSCNEGTQAMGSALEMVEEQMPGFFDLPERPTNRLLVQFTDWELGGADYLTRETEYIQKALASGVNMLSIVPRSYSERSSRWGPRSALPAILAKCKVLRGAATMTRYNPMFPDQAWTDAATALVR
jgi:hypothetical protein